MEAVNNLGPTIKDLLPIPDTLDPVAEPGKVELADTMVEEPTLSHALAQQDAPEEEPKGAAQMEHEEEVIDLGWNEPAQKIANPVVGGLSNDDLFILIRRFNKQMYHLKETPYSVPGGLDLNIADDEEFSPDKLRSNLERLYMTVIIGLIGASKHIFRLRSWRETRRTSYFCAVYFVAWLFDFIVPTLCAVLIALIVWPESREIMFPPAPIALVSTKGGVQKPKSGVLGSTDSVTGAPEAHKGEAVEQEASNFVTSIASVALASAAGKHPQSDPEASDEGADPADSAPDPTALALGAAEAKQKAAGGKPNVKHDKTKVPMENAIWTQMRPLMHGLANFTDAWERVGNALSPTPPFPRDKYRLRLAALIVPALATSVFVTSYMFMKGVTFGIGFAFFGDPVITPGLHFLNQRFPNWQKLLELRNTVLKGVPTNAQLTITLLRLGEANKAPIPPPPRATAPPPDKPANITDKHLRAAGADWPLSATKEELDEAMAHDPTTKHETGGTDIDAAKSTKHGKRGSRILNFFKGTTKATIESAITADTLKAKAGSSNAKNRLGVVPRGADPDSGPIEFLCRYHGHKGHVYLTTKATIPCVAFSTDKTIEKIGSQDREDLHPAWSIPIGDIRELKKIGGYGWKAKILVGWALDRTVKDGLVITDRAGSEWYVTAMPLRDELFNRLASMGGQKWVSW